MRPLYGAHRRAVAAIAIGARRNRVRVTEREDGALEIPGEAVTNPVAYTQALAAEAERHGAAVWVRCRVEAIEAETDGLSVRSASGATVRCGIAVNCAGLYADEVARRASAVPDLQIVPFRGEYYMLRPERRHLVRGLIYPVPDPEFPFLGVHFTRTVHGDVEAGPNAVLAFAREGYRFGRVNLRELAATLGYRGFRAMARRYWKVGVYEMYRSLSRGAFVRALQRLVPAVSGADLRPGGAGVRAQAVSPDGSLVDDFRIVQAADAIHVLNAPSPAATASLAIGRHIAALAADAFALR
jgi:L-2-hydroxyglutarate oxidase